MLFGELLDDERQEGLVEGRKEGQNEANQLWSCLLRLISPADLTLLQNDPTIIQTMLDKYHISNPDSDQ